MGRAIGIDLGTTNTAVAVLKEGRPYVLEDEKGYKVLPSTVSLKDDGKFVVGQAARALLLTRPDFTVYAIKRLMGRRFDSPEVEAVRQRLPFDVQPAPDGTCLISMGDQAFTPVEVSALILQVARSIAERALGEAVEEAVITVPAYFNHAQRAATFEAAQLAGLRCERLLNEPTAAALAYGFRRDIDRTIVIYDLGGGTFDVSVLRMSSGVYEILATRGDTFLGGEDFDHRVVDHLANHFEATHKVDLREDRTTLQRLKDASERAKCELSFTDRTTILIPRVTHNENLEQVVTRLTLETLVEDLVQRTLEIVRKAVAEAGLKLSDVDDVILVGGQTRMPRVREAVGALFKKEPSRSVHPEEAVALGAAVHASSLDSPDGKAPVLLDVTPFDLGIDVAGGLFQAVIGRNSQVPSAQTRSFATVQDNQESVLVTVRQGYSRLAAENEFLGEFVLSGLTPAPRMQTKVDVTFRLDTNGMLHVLAVEPATGERKRITVRNYAEVVAAKGGSAFQVDGDVLKQRARPQEATPGEAAPATPPPPTPGPATAAAPAEPAPARTKGAGRLASFFGRVSRLGKDGRAPAEGPVTPAEAGPTAGLSSQTPPPSPQVEEQAEPEALELSALEALPEDASSAAASAEKPDPALHTLVPADLEHSVPPSQPGGRIVLPEVPPMPALGTASEDRDRRSPLLPAAEARDEEPEADLAVNTVAIFGLAGDSPSWERPDPPPQATGAAVAAGPVTRGPALGGEPTKGADGKWDFGLDIAEDLGDDEDFEKLFHALERGAEAAAPPARPAPPRHEDPDESNPTLMPLDTASLLAPTPPPTPAPPPRPRVRDRLPTGPVTPPPSSALRPSQPARGAAPPPPPVASSSSTLGGVEGDAHSQLLGEEEIYKLFSMTPSVTAQRPTAPAPPQGSGRASKKVEDMFAVADEVFSMEEPPRRPPPRRPDPPPPAPPPAPPPSPTPPVGAETGRKPARLKLAYPRLDALIAEYRENLRRGGCFIRTGQPLPVGREVRIEVRAPGLAEPLELFGVVTTASSGPASATRAQPEGMTIEYRLDPAQRRALERLVAQGKA